MRGGRAGWCEAMLLRLAPTGSGLTRSADSSESSIWTSAGLRDREFASPPKTDGVWPASMTPSSRVLDGCPARRHHPQCSGHASSPELLVDQVRHGRFDGPGRMTAVRASGLLGRSGGAMEFVWEPIG